MKRLLAEPLVHFMGGGLILLFLVGLFSGNSDDESSSPSQRIHVDGEALRQFVQSKTRVRDPVSFASIYDDLSPVMKRKWLDRFVREEALVREARRLGLQEQDDLIRRRLVQKIEFVALGLVESELEFGPEELEETYRARVEDYRVPATLSFSHVFLRATDEASFESAKSRAEALLGVLNAAGLGAGDVLGQGDRFLYNRNYVDRTQGEVASHFGEPMAAELARLEPDARHWQGPFRSPLGFHLVLLTKSEPSRLPRREEIRELLHEDWLRQTRDAALDRAVAGIVSSYAVDLDLDADLEPLGSDRALP